LLIPSLLAAALIAYAIKRLFLGYPQPKVRLDVMRPREAAFLDAAADAIFPAGGAIPLAGRDAALPSYNAASRGLITSSLTFGCG
jgi:hypothetical protein